MPSATFDGDNLIITLAAPVNGVAGVNVKRDLYSAWKVWAKTGTNAKYPLAFATGGGEAVTPTQNTADYYFLQNQKGWRIRPYEANQSVSFTNGNLVPADLDLPYVVPTLGAYTVLGLGIQPIAQTVETGGGDGFTADDRTTLGKALSVGKFLALK